MATRRFHKKRQILSAQKRIFMIIRKSLLLSTLLASAFMLQACAGNGESDYRLTKQELAMLKKGPQTKQKLAYNKRKTNGKPQQIAMNKTAKQKPAKPQQQFAMNKQSVIARKSVMLQMATNTIPGKAKVLRPTSQKVAMNATFANGKNNKKPARSLVFASKVNDSELTTVRGAFSPDTFDWAALTANSRNNTLSGNSVTGANFVTDSAFNGAAGLVNVIQNSGNNVIIQSATIVNLTLQ